MTTPQLPPLPEPAGALFAGTGPCAPMSGYDADQMRAYAFKALAASRVKSAAPFDVEALILAAVPPGWSCDPQQVADAIRDYCAQLAAPIKKEQEA